jgi:checkpoint serine/threonine-protein kinase
VLPWADHGTLRDHVNRRKALGGQVDQNIAVFFMCELMRAVAQLHAAGFLHGHICAENVLMRMLDEDSEEEWTPMYDSTGEGGWCHNGVALVDFARSVDLQRFPVHQRFQPGWSKAVEDFPLIRTNNGFRLDIDWYGCAAVAYTLMYGRRLELKDYPSQESDEEINSSSSASQSVITLAPREATPSGWDTELWTGAFEQWLNVASLAT